MIRLFLLSERQMARISPLIPSPHEHDRFAHWRVPMDIMSHGWSASLFQA